MVTFGQRVKVYRNLRTGNFSIMDAKTGKVIDHKDSFYIQDAEFRVQPGGQKRAREKGQRNVHAYVIGDYFGPLNFEPGVFNVKQIHYNPFVDNWFNDGESMVAVASMVLFHDQKAYI